MTSGNEHSHMSWSGSAWCVCHVIPFTVKPLTARFHSAYPIGAPSHWPHQSRHLVIQNSPIFSLESSVSVDCGFKTNQLWSDYFSELFRLIRIWWHLVGFKSTCFFKKGQRSLTDEFLHRPFDGNDPVHSNTSESFQTAAAEESTAYWQITPWADRGHVSVTEASWLQ